MERKRYGERGERERERRERERRERVERRERERERERGERENLPWSLTEVTTCLSVQSKESGRGSVTGGHLHGTYHTPLVPLTQEHTSH